MVIIRDLLTIVGHHGVSVEAWDTVIEALDAVIEVDRRGVAGVWGPHALLGRACGRAGSLAVLIAAAGILTPTQLNGFLLEGRSFVEPVGETGVLCQSADNAVLLRAVTSHQQPCAKI